MSDTSYLLLARIDQQALAIREIAESLARIERNLSLERGCREHFPLNVGHLPQGRNVAPIQGPASQSQSSEVIELVLIVDHVDYSVDGGFKIRYSCRPVNSLLPGQQAQTYTQTIRLENSDPARRYFETWFRQRNLTGCPTPATAQEALDVALSGGLREPAQILIEVSPDYPTQIKRITVTKWRDQR